MKYQIDNLDNLLVKQNDNVSRITQIFDMKKSQKYLTNLIYS